jgi:RNA polymerase sigma-70 factor, ECF subfamily
VRAARPFFERWYPRLVRYLHARLGDVDQAEDIAQEAFVRLLDFRPDHPAAWLFTVAANLASDETRVAEGRRRHLALIRVEEAGDEVDPSEVLVRSEEIAHVRRALAALSERDRTLLLLHHEGCRYREIAQHLGVAPSSVGSLLTRAQRRFARRFVSGGVSNAQHARG